MMGYDQSAIRYSEPFNAYVAVIAPMPASTRLQSVNMRRRKDNQNDRTI